MEDEKKVLHLANATAQILDDPYGYNLVYTNGSPIDKMEIPKDYKKLIEVCRFFYKRDPICGTVHNKIVDCAISPLNNRKGLCSDEEFEVYNSLRDMLQEFFRNACLEYLLSGMVIPHYEWVRKSGVELSPKLNSRKRVNVPDNIWFRNPSTVEVKNSPIPNRKYFYVEVDTETVKFIQSGGKLSDGSYDKDTYDDLVKNYPEFVEAVKKLKNARFKIRLEGVRPILARTLTEEPYPVPYMSNALEALMHKRNLRKMDYSIAARVIAAIQLIKLGDKDFPVTDDADFNDIKTQMSYRTADGAMDRIYQLFANHTLSIEWVFPDTAAMLNRDKYASVEDDIIAGLGFPRTLITGETIRSNVEGGSDMASFSPIATMETIRDKFLEWVKVLYKEIADKNGFKNVAIPSFSPMKLYSLKDLNDIGSKLYEEGTMSRTTRLESQGYDIETEIERKKSEMELYKKNNIPEAPAMPFSSPSIGKQGGARPVKKPAAKKPAAKAEDESVEEVELDDD